MMKAIFQRQILFSIRSLKHFSEDRKTTVYSYRELMVLKPPKKLSLTLLFYLSGMEKISIEVSHDSRWKNLINDSQSLLRKMRFGKYKLPSDWVVYTLMIKSCPSENGQHDLVLMLFAFLFI